MMIYYKDTVHEAVMHRYIYIVYLSMAKNLSLIKKFNGNLRLYFSTGTVGSVVQNECQIVVLSVLYIYLYIST